MRQLLQDRSWTYDYDDSEIDAIIWSEIKASPSMGDFVCYLIHRLSNAKHRDEAQQRIAAFIEGESMAPLGTPAQLTA